MSGEEESSVVWEISVNAVGGKNLKHASLKSFFMAKLGVSAGENLYKELMRGVDDATHTAIDLGHAGGLFIQYRSL